MPWKNFFMLSFFHSTVCAVCACAHSFPPVKFHVLAVCLCLCVRVKRCECTLYIFLLSLRLHLLASLQWLDLSRLLAVCQRRKICARLTSCHCTPLFLTSILLSAFSPSIIHGSVQTFVFCLNNWLKAWSERRDACISVVGGKSEWWEALKAHMFFSRLPRQWIVMIKNSFGSASSAHLSPS